MIQVIMIQKSLIIQFVIYLSEKKKKIDSKSFMSENIIFLRLKFAHKCVEKFREEK